MTRQEALEAAYLGVLSQGGPSTDHSHLVCAYRGQGGRKCAIGHIIPDGQYASKLERLRPLWAVKESRPLVTILEGLGFTSVDQSFIVDLQLAHDQAAVQSQVGRDVWNIGAFTYKFTRGMEAVARQYGLTLPAAPMTSVS